MKLVTHTKALHYSSDTAPDVLAFSEVGLEGVFPKPERTPNDDPFVQNDSGAVTFIEDENGLHINIEYVPYYEEEYGPYENEYAGAETGGSLYLSKVGIPLTEHNLSESEWERYTEDKKYVEHIITTTCEFKGVTYDVVGYFAED